MDKGKENLEIYDILDIPYFPYVPGILEWLLIGGILILFCLLTYYFIEVRSKRITRFSFKNMALQEIRSIEKKLRGEITDGATLNESLFMLSKYAKKSLLELKGYNLEQLSLHEIKQLKNGSNSKFFEYLVQVEELKYSPNKSQEDAHKLALGLMNELIELSKVK